MDVRELARPYRSAFASRFQLLLQYRSAAVAGFITQCWWGGIKVMILAAFYQASPVAAAEAPLTLTQAITYTWVMQAALALLPWLGDPDVALAVRTGAVSYDRLRPLDLYALWYARAAGWIVARMLPRAALMFLFAGIALPLLGLGAWGWHLPASIAAGSMFLLSMVLGALLSSSMIMLINLAIAASLNDRGVNALASPIVIVFSGNLLPLQLFPDWIQTAMLLQPFAGLIDIPLRIYFGSLAGIEACLGIGLQVIWIAALAALGHWAMSRTLRTLELQGG
jgi:ABC-2 type transport system permease protein